MLSLLVRGWKAAYDAEWSTRQPNTKYYLRAKQAEFIAAIKLASGIQIDALSERETVTPRDEFLTAVRVYYPTGGNIKVKDVTPSVPSGWAARTADIKTDAGTPTFRTEVAKFSTAFKFVVPADAPPTQPYWLEQPRDVDVYRWPAGEGLTHPFQPPLVSVNVTFDIDGVEVKIPQSVEYRFADDVRGEIRREVNVVPMLTVRPDEKLIVVPQSEKISTRQIRLSIANNSLQPLKKTVSLDLGNSGGLGSSPGSLALDLPPGRRTAAIFAVTIPANTKPGTYSVSAKIDGQAALNMHAIAYPHIQTHRFYTPASLTVKVMDLRAVTVKVGYVMGTGDEVPTAIRQLGSEVKMLETDDLESADLSVYDAIVIGIRAFHVRPDLASNYERLIDYVRNGGTLIVQYQQSDYERFLPFPGKIGPRVAEEDAPVTILQPDHPIFNIPNKITEIDFKNWIQERNLSDLSTFDDHYLSLLESHDTGAKAD
jgi:hypothetical protein